MSNAIEVPFTKPRISLLETQYLGEVGQISAPWGGGEFYKKSAKALGEISGSVAAYPTQSCTVALELVALYLGIEPGDEVIVPSYTFVSSAAAFASRGAKIVFADVDPQEMNLDLNSIESLVTNRTRAIVAVNYGGLFSNIQAVARFCSERAVTLIEDAAQSVGSFQNGRHLGTFGQFGCLSFHGTKNISSGEGGALLVNDPSVDLERIEILLEKGTNRRKYIRGQVDKYTWVDLGSSFLPSEFTSAVLLAQLEELNDITRTRLDYKAAYRSHLSQVLAPGQRLLGEADTITTEENGHMVALIAGSGSERQFIVEELRSRGIQATSHYEPLHLSPFVLQNYGFQPALPITEDLAPRLLRLPMWSAKGLDVERVCEALAEINVSISKVPKWH